jgi:hypothetical protein
VAVAAVVSTAGSSGGLEGKDDTAGVGAGGEEEGGGRRISPWERSWRWRRPSQPLCTKGDPFLLISKTAEVGEEEDDERTSDQVAEEAAE